MRFGGRKQFLLASSALCGVSIEKFRKQGKIINIAIQDKNIRPPVLGFELGEDPIRIFPGFNAARRASARNADLPGHELVLAQPQ